MKFVDISPSTAHAFSSTSPRNQGKYGPSVAELSLKNFCPFAPTKSLGSAGGTKSRKEGVFSVPVAGKKLGCPGGTAGYAVASVPPKRICCATEWSSRCWRYRLMESRTFPR